MLSLSSPCFCTRFLSDRRRGEFDKKRGSYSCRAGQQQQQQQQQQRYDDDDGDDGYDDKEEAKMVHCVTPLTHRRVVTGAAAAAAMSTWLLSPLAPYPAGSAAAASDEVEREDVKYNNNEVLFKRIHI